MLKKINKKVSGYKIFHNFDGSWSLFFGNNHLHGSLKEVIKYAVNHLSFEIDELEYAIGCMEDGFHDFAEFGICQSFLFSKSLKEVSTLQ